MLALAVLATASESPERECCDAERRGQHYDVRQRAPGDVLFVPAAPELGEHVELLEFDVDENDVRLPEFVPELSPAERATVAAPVDGDNDLRSTTGSGGGRIF